MLNVVLIVADIIMLWSILSRNSVTVRQNLVKRPIVNTNLNGFNITLHQCPCRNVQQIKFSTSQLLSQFKFGKSPLPK